MTYKPQEYWQQRLGKHFDLQGVGHISFDQKYNQRLYALKLSRLEHMTNKHNICLRGKSICDIGCGTGFFINYYKKNDVQYVIGIDITTVSIERLKNLFPAFDFIVSDIGREPIAIIADAVDIVNAFDVFYHIIEDNLFEYAVSNITRILKKGGIAFITDVFGRKDSLPARHVHFRSRQIWGKILAKYNMHVLDILPLYYSMNHVFAPPFLLNKTASLLYSLDKTLQRTGLSNGMNIKLLVARKE